MTEPSFLLFMVADRTCALPIGCVQETMRPLDVEPVGDAPEFVLGAAILRGRPTPIVDAGALLSGHRLVEPGRWISLKTGGERSVGLQVSSVIGVYSAAALDLSEAPPLLQGTDSSVLEGLGRRDEALLSVLRLGHLVPESAVWLERSGGPA